MQLGIPVSARRDDTRDAANRLYALLQVAQSLLTAPGGISGSSVTEERTLQYVRDDLTTVLTNVQEFIRLREQMNSRLFPDRTF